MSVLRTLHNLLPGRVQLAAARLLRGVRSLFFRGDAVFCACCERSFSRFLTVGSPPRPAGCPYCGARERQRLLFLYLRNETDCLTRGRSILHFAPEDWAQQTFSSIEGARYVSADLFSPTAMVRADITNLDFDEDAFDLILCSHVLEHVPDDARAMREMLRVLKRGGMAIVQVPLDRTRAETYEDWSITAPAAREQAFGQSDHVRWYGRDFVARLRSAGFEVTAIPYAAQLDVHRLGLDPHEEIYRCVKP